MRDEQYYDFEGSTPPGGGHRRKKKNGYGKAAVVFFGGLIIGVCVMLVVVRIRKGQYDEKLVAEAVDSIVSGERPLTQEDIEKIRINTEVSEEEIDELLSKYDQDAQRIDGAKAGESEDGNTEESDISSEMTFAEVGEMQKEAPQAENPPAEAEVKNEDTVELQRIYADESEDGADIQAADTGSNKGTGVEVETSGSEAAASVSQGDVIRRMNDLREDLMSGMGTTPSLRKFFKGQIMVTSGGRFYFYPITDELEHHNYDEAALRVSEDGSLYYEDKAGRRAKKGIDVSKHQGVIDWEKVAADGVEFAIIRAGYRGYGSGELMADDTFLANATAASAQGIEVGAYVFSQAINEEEAREEARLVIGALGGESIAYPIVFDQEKVNGSRINFLSMQQYTDITLAFCDEVRSAGYEPMIYGNLESFFIMLDMKRLEGISKWFAYYNTDMYYPYSFDIWQYSSKGRVDGISGDVDLNISFR